MKGKLSNPFYRMVYSEDICELMNKNHWFFSILLRGKNNS